MGETAQILALWRRARERGQQVCLATVVHIEGSSYRKRGARMLLAESGERAGMVSGGCLEAEIGRKAWWLTSEGPSLQEYQSSFDEDAGGIPWGLGCGGTIWVLLEREPHAVLEALAAAQEGRAGVVAMRLGAQPGTVRVQFLDDPGTADDALAAALQAAGESQAWLALDQKLEPTEMLPEWSIDVLAPPPRLTLFGAGDDAQPIARFAEELGWRVTVADGRAHLLRPERFGPAVRLKALTYGDAVSAPSCGIAAGADEAQPIPDVETGVGPGEFAVLLTHSWEQDRALLRALLPVGLAYLGVLGPRHRTERLLEQVAPALGWSLERCRRDLHAPVGLDLGGHDPASIALSIVAELQATVAARTVTVHPATAAARD